MAAFLSRQMMLRFLSDDEGATAIEYGLIVALLTIVMIAGLSALGGGTSGMWGGIQTQVGNAMK
jgi:pilus assembly protein Flp/PilA